MGFNSGFKGLMSFRQQCPVLCHCVTLTWYNGRPYSFNVVNYQVNLIKDFWIWSRFHLLSFRYVFSWGHAKRILKNGFNFFFFQNFILSINERSKLIRSTVFRNLQSCGMY